MNTSNYTEFLRNIIGSELNNWDSPEWNKLLELISEQVLEDAYNQKEKMSDFLSNLNLQFESRPKKSITRILKKMEEVKQGKGFKVNSDFLAYRIHCTPDQIENVIADIKKNVIRSDGLFHVRNERRVDQHGKPLDIVQYMFVYLKNIGYICELQIGHPFAGYTFAIDSQLRDDPNCGLVDLWTNNFYSKVVKKILDPTFDLDVKSELFKILPNPPKQLLTILNLEC